MIIEKFNSFDGKVPNSLINDILLSIDNRFNRKIASLTDIKNRRVELVEKLTVYLLSLDKFTISEKRTNNTLYFYSKYDNEYLTIDIFNKILEICDNVDSLSYNFVEFRTSGNHKITCSEIKEYGNTEYLKRNRISMISIDYNI